MFSLWTPRADCYQLYLRYVLKPGSTEPTDVYACHKAINDVTAEPVTYQSGVEMAEAYNLVMSQVGMDDQSSPTELANNTEAITKYWEVESVQSLTTDVQGHLKKKWYAGKKCYMHPHQYWTVLRIAIGCP